MVQNVQSVKALYRVCAANAMIGTQLSCRRCVPKGTGSSAVDRPLRQEREESELTLSRNWQRLDRSRCGLARKSHPRLDSEILDRAASSSRATRAIMDAQHFTQQGTTTRTRRWYDGITRGCYDGLKCAPLEENVSLELRRNYGFFSLNT